MKVVLVSTIIPSGHFSEILCKTIQNYTNIDLVVFADRNPRNRLVKTCKNIKNIWRKGAKYVLDIVRGLPKDKADIIHIQQELNMYGGPLTICMFPFLLLILKLQGYKVVTTIHAAVYQRQIDRHFLSFFLMKPVWYIQPYTLKCIFFLLFASTSFLSDRIVCHSEMMKDILTSDYSVNRDKVTVIRTTIPERAHQPAVRENHFLYFGYIVRRKGIEQLIEGFKKISRQYPNFRLVLAGGTIRGQEKAKKEIQQIIKKYKLEDKIELTGFIDHKKIEELYQHAYAVVIPAKISMGSSGPLYHAQSYGKCILASDIGHFKEDIQHMKNGVLVNNTSWHKALKQIIANKVLLHSLESGVRRMAKKKLPPIIAQKYKDMYSSLLNP